MKKIVSAFVILGLVLGFTVSESKAAEQKIAIVTLQEALNNVNQGKSAKEKLQKDFKKKQAEIEKEKQDLQKQAESLQKQGSVLSADARQQKAQELQKQFMELQNKAANYERELKMAEAESANQIIEKLGEIVEEIAKKEGYTLVIENSQRTVLFSSTATDITEEVIKVYNKKNK